MFDNIKINLLKKKIETEKEISKKNNRFSLFHTKIFNDYINSSNNYEALESIYNVGNSWKGNLSYNFGISLEDFVNRDDLSVCVHRTYLGLDSESSGLPQSSVLNSIMSDGLINNGHANAFGGSAFLEGYPSLSLTTTPIDGVGGYVNFIAPYKDNDATIIMAFPTEYVSKDGNIIKGNEDKIYDISNDLYYIKPEYIIGALLKKENGFDEFHLRDEILNSTINKNI